MYCTVSIAKIECEYYIITAAWHNIDSRWGGDRKGCRAIYTLSWANFGFSRFSISMFNSVGRHNMTYIYFVAYQQCSIRHLKERLQSYNQYVSYILLVFGNSLDYSFFLVII